MEKNLTGKEKRQARLLPDGMPRYVRCYDNGGESADRYTVVYTGNYKGRDGCQYVGMSANPSHPQGVGMHDWAQNIVDRIDGNFPPAIGRKNHLGKRIPFSELPEDCRKTVMKAYKEIWQLD